ncbi:MAG: Zn-dependent hydrolase [Burkholderiaceae bacterium]|nr:Zn-dependent hydrolase [Burkholderiaceae bacterium]
MEGGAKERGATIRGDRLWRSLMELAEVGAIANGGVCRLALSDEDRQGRDLFVRWCREAGCSVAIDAVGNVFARRRGRSDSLPPIVTGSHLDTQPNGGRFDGAYGVMAGLEVVRALNDAGIRTEAPIEVVAWTNEEGTRFAPSMMGSMAFAGLLPIGTVLGSRDAQGCVFGDELERIGYRGEGLGERRFGAYFEAHIEQGPVLEETGHAIGVVTGGQGQRWYDVVLTGQAAHAGSTPMDRRRDALLGAAQVIEAVNRIGTGYPPGGVATVGHLSVSPGSRNVIPGEVSMSIEIRHPDDRKLLGMDAAIREAVAAVAGRVPLQARLDMVLDQPATPFDDACIGAVREAARAESLRYLEMISGAAHDAIAIARVAPAAMIFVPCAGGISHNEAESAAPQDLADGCRVLLRAMLACAGGPE